VVQSKWPKSAGAVVHPYALRTTCGKSKVVLFIQRARDLGAHSNHASMYIGAPIVGVLTLIQRAEAGAMVRPVVRKQ
jgi:hypothetical protein